MSDHSLSEELLPGTQSELPQLIFQPTPCVLSPGDGEKHPAPPSAPPQPPPPSPSCTNPVHLPSFTITHHKYFAGPYFIIKTYGL